MPMMTATEASYGNAEKPGLFDAPRRHAARIVQTYRFTLLPEDHRTYTREIAQGGVRIFVELSGRTNNDKAVVSVFRDGDYFWGWETVDGGAWERVYSRDGYWMAAQLKQETARQKKAERQAKADAKQARRERRDHAS